MSINVESSVSAGGTEPIQSDPVRAFSFDSVHEQAMAFGDEAPAENTPEAKPQEQAPVEQAPVAEPEPTNVEAASEKQLAQLKDDDLVEVTVDGEKVTMPWSEARGGVMRQAKFTKEMQTFRAEQKAFETERQTLSQMREEREILITLLKDPKRLQEFIQQQYPTLMQAQQQVAEASQTADPTDIATMGQIQEAQRQMQAQMEGVVKAVQVAFEKREAALTQSLEDKAEVAKLGGQIRTVVDSLFESHPYMNDVIPHAEQVLRYQVSLLDPRTPEETLEAFKTVFGGWVENYKKSVAATTKKAVIEKHKLETNNIAPPGGAQVQPEKQTFLTKTRSGKTDVDWKSLNKTAMEMLNKK